MADMKKAFETAAKEVTKLPKRPSDSQMLELYSLYKQATDGDVAGERPGMLNLTGRAKYDAWAKRKGTSKDKAMQAYVDLVAKLKKGA
jgi:acyl-CoA-binding protein